MDAAVIELDALPDAVWPAAEDDDLAAVAGRGLALRLAKGRGLVGRIHVGRDCFELGGAAVDALEDGVDAKLAAQRADFCGAGGPCHRDERVVEQARTLGLGFAHPACHTDRTHRQRGEALVGETHRFQTAQACGIARQAVLLDGALGIDDAFDLAQEPRVVEGHRGHFLDAHAFSEGLRDLQQPVGRAAGERGGDDLLARAFQLDDAVEPVEPGF